jgi:hypothetical protein
MQAALYAERWRQLPARLMENGGSPSLAMEVVRCHPF